MRLLFVALFAILSTALTGQTIPDSIGANIVQIDDSTYTVKTYVLFIDEDGRRSESTLTSAPMDSASVGWYLLNADTRGLRTDGVQVIARQQVAAIAQRFFMSSAAVGTVFPDLYETHTGKGMDESIRGFDNLFVGNWVLLERKTGIEVEMEIVRRNNGRLVASTVAGNTRADIPSRNEIELRNVPGVTGSVSFFRVKPGSNAFRTIDSQFVLRPNRNASKNK